MFRIEIYTALLLACLLGIESVPREDSSLGVVGGKAVNITDVPFMARYFSQRRRIFCGATVIHANFLVTSADCYYLVKYFRSPSYVIVGADETREGGEAYDVKEGFPHPDFSPASDDYNIAVLQVAKPMKFSERVQPVSLPEKNLIVPEGATFETLGFGSMSGIIFDLKLADKLQQATVPMVAPEKCKRFYTRLTDRMICAGGDRKGSCFYDYGGPLMYKKVLVGVLSDIVGCGRKDRPSVYAYVPALRDFIDSIIQPAA